MLIWTGTRCVPATGCERLSPAARLDLPQACAAAAEAAVQTSAPEPRP